MANQEMEKDLVLSEEELAGAAGGVKQAGDAIVAYCKKCGKKLSCLGTQRISGGLTNIFQCENAGCTEFHKQKNNLEVNWPR